jgi:hypothetical protein
MTRRFFFPLIAALALSITPMAVLGTAVRESEQAYEW